MERVDVALTDCFHRAAFFRCPVEDFVVDISEILHEGHFVVTPDQIAAQHIPNDVAAGMAKMAEVIDRDTAAVDAGLAFP